MSGQNRNIVLYTDGGFLLDKKKGGAGIHGYIYEGMSEKQENIQAKWTPTQDGYVERAEGIKSVDIKNYVDIAKGLDRVTSSSESELNAINIALKWIQEEGSIYESVSIYTDSQNIVSGITSWINNWKKKNWISSNGKPVKFVELWKEVDKRMEEIRETTRLSFTWIKGHAGHIGNEKADNLANRGIILEKNNEDDIFVSISEYRSYWNPPASVRAPRILDGPRLYTSTFERKIPDLDEPVTYYMGSHGAKSRLAEEQGKVYPCNYLAVLNLTKPDPVITEMDKLVQDIESKRGGVQGTLVTYNLQNLLTGRFYSEVLEDGLTFTSRLSYPILISNAQAAPLAEEIVPVGRAFRLTDYCSTVKRILDDIPENKNVKRISILDYFFDMSKKKDGTEKRIIKKNFTNSLKTIKVDGEFSTNKVDMSKDLFKRKVTLIIGTDTPSRNTLSNLAEEIIEFDLVSWRESENSVRYGVYMKLESGDEGLWTKYDSNLILKPR